MGMRTFFSIFISDDVTPAPSVRSCICGSPNSVQLVSKARTKVVTPHRHLDARAFAHPTANTHRLIPFSSA
jgi:hypothetical protein